MIFSLAVIIVAGLGADYLCRRFRLPGILGMLAVGVAVGPYGFHLLEPPLLAVSADLRKLALIIILLRAGFGLQRQAVNQAARPAVLMAVVPTLLEMGGATVLSQMLLDLPWLEAAVLGAILSGVSPALIVPAMIDFIERRKGQKKGLPTIVLASASLNNVLAVVVFTIFLGMRGGSAAGLGWQLAGIPVSIVLGIVLGLIPGLILVELFRRYDLATPRRTLIILGVALLLTQTEVWLRNLVPIASLLGVMAIGFIILEKEEAIAHIIAHKLKRIWVFAELVLFVLIGAQVNVGVIWKAGLVGLAIIGGGLAWRSLGVWLSVRGIGLTWRETVFCVMSNLPKATIQAAVGAVPLEAGLAGGEVILAIAVLSIIVTTPAGAVGIDYTGNRFLAGDGESVFRFRMLRERLNLPRVGSRVRRRADGAIWKIISEVEVWVEEISLGVSQETSVPGIALRFWLPRPDQPRGTGKTMSHTYTAQSSSFQQDWEVMPE